MGRRPGLTLEERWGEGTPAPLSRRSLFHATIAAAFAVALPPVRAQSRTEHLTASASLPAWQALDFDGRSTPVPAAGKATVVNFWATWCAPCRKEMPLLQQMADFYSDKLVLQAVDFKERAVAVQRHVRESGWTVPVLLDPSGAGAEAWGIKVFPTTIGFDARGRPRWRVMGEYDWGSPEAGKLVESLWA